MESHRPPMRRSRDRLAVWRGVKKLGTVIARQSLWMLPYKL